VLRLHPGDLDMVGGPAKRMPLAAISPSQAAILHEPDRLES
jgi:hypothetical protein